MKWFSRISPRNKADKLPDYAKSDQILMGHLMLWLFLGFWMIQILAHGLAGFVPNLKLALGNFAMSFQRQGCVNLAPDVPTTASEDIRSGEIWLRHLTRIGGSSQVLKMTKNGERRKGWIGVGDWHIDRWRAPSPRKFVWWFFAAFNDIKIGNLANLISSEWKSNQSMTCPENENAYVTCVK